MRLYFQYKSQFILSIFVPVKLTGINKTHSLPESCRSVGPSDADWPASGWWLEIGSWPIKWLLASELPDVPRDDRIITVSFRNAVWETKITLGGETEKTWIKKPWRTGGAQRDYVILQKPKYTRGGQNYKQKLWSKKKKKKSRGKGTARKIEGKGRPTERNRHPRLLSQKSKNLGPSSIVGPPYPQVPHPQMQPTADWKYSGEKSSRKFHKAISWNCHVLAIIYIAFIRYLHSIYIALGIISNLGII